MISVYILNQFNIFTYFLFIPESLKNEIGLVVYNTIVQALWEFIANKMNKRKAKIKFIFYISGQNADINTNPTIECKTSINAASINYSIEISGNSKKLKKCNLYLQLPTWLSSQLDKKDTILFYEDNKIKWDFNNLVVGNCNIDNPSNITYKLYFISNINNNLSLYLKPKLIKGFGIKLETNSLHIKNGG